MNDDVIMTQNPLFHPGRYISNKKIYITIYYGRDDILAQKEQNPDPKVMKAKKVSPLMARPLRGGGGG